ncbi:hypothetical protein GNF83_22970, partial [Clostridium perfringens]|nr:hypothetical protein [Clostridium perfringens]
VYIYEGFLHYMDTGAIEGAEAEVVVPSTSPAPAVVTRPAPVRHDSHSAQAKLNTEDIEFLYDMEFFIDRTRGGVRAFHEDTFRKALAQNGDSIIVIADDEIIKVHVHSRKPGEGMDLAMQYGELIK